GEDAGPTAAAARDRGAGPVRATGPRPRAGRAGAAEEPGRPVPVVLGVRPRADVGGPAPPGRRDARPGRGGDDVLPPDPTRAVVGDPGPEAGGRDYCPVPAAADRARPPAAGCGRHPGPAGRDGGAAEPD